MAKTRKLPQAILDLIAILDNDAAAVVALAAKDARVADCSETDVEGASILATKAAALLPAPPKATPEEKLRAKAVAKANAVALALGDIAAHRAPSTASLPGIKSMAKVGPTAAVEAALSELASTGMADLAANLEATTCGRGKGGFIKGKTKAPNPVAKAWRLLTGAAAMSKILTPEQVLAKGAALVAKEAKAAA